MDRAQAATIALAPGRTKVRDTTAMILSNVIPGAVVVACGLAATSMAMMLRRA